MGIRNRTLCGRDPFAWRLNADHNVLARVGPAENGLIMVSK